MPPVPYGDEAYLRKLTIRVVEDVYQAFATVARSKGMSMNALANQLLWDYLAAQDYGPVADRLRATEDQHRRRVERIRRRAWP